MMHEHINYYTEHSLTTHMRNCGGNVIDPLAATTSNEGAVRCLGG